MFFEQIGLMLESGSDYEDDKSNKYPDIYPRVHIVVVPSNGKEIAKEWVRLGALLEFVTYRILKAQICLVGR